MFQHMMHYTARRSNVALYGSPSALDVSVKCFGNVSTHDALYGSPRPSARPPSAPNIGHFQCRIQAFMQDMFFFEICTPLIV